jgi:hypothetical protein
MDDRDLAKMLDDHLYDHRARNRVRVDERGWMVIRHQGCDRRVAEWPDAQGMWPLTYEHLMEEARIHQEREHDP